ncbi:hypothetical protein [uncultured Lactobacillus sp.]|uniref:hypothetical protein n=1 Tax=uncultured Lactobacillus sp. TaxID=153152 RepID=UPI00262018EC|nr:hypothetical protein [uncultured Lactobacillus sp.]
MFTVSIDITEAMKGFSKFAEQGDMTHAMDEIMIICKKTTMPPRDVLKQIKFAAKKNGIDTDYKMASRILGKLEQEHDRYLRKSEVIENAVEDIKIGLNEISHSGNPVWIKNFIKAIKLDLKEIEDVL